ncbi:MAG: NAD(P)H-dependent oxidoreductase [Bacteroides sp.]
MRKEEILAAYQFRHACKEFDPTKQISDDDFRFILETGRLSPSSLGLEPWHFLVIQKPELRERLKERAWGATLKLETASHFVVCLSMKAPLIRFDAPYVEDFMRRVQKLPEEGIKARIGFFETFQKEDFQLTSDRALFDWAAKQSYIALGNMMTAAALIGIDSCPIEGFHSATSEAILAEELGIDFSQYGIAYMVAFGYRKSDPGEKTRRPMEELVSWY